MSDFGIGAANWWGWANAAARPVDSSDSDESTDIEMAEAIEFDIEGQKGIKRTASEYLGADFIQGLEFKRIKTEDYPRSIYNLYLSDIGVEKLLKQNYGNDLPQTFGYGRAKMAPPENSANKAMMAVLGIFKEQQMDYRPNIVALTKAFFKLEASKIQECQHLSQNYIDRVAELFVTEHKNKIEEILSPGTLRWIKDWTPEYTGHEFKDDILAHHVTGAV